jgi:SRSO17 transposase
LASGHRDPCRPSRARLQRRDAEHQPVSAKDLAFTLPPSAWQTVSWREGSRGDLSGRFATVRVRPSHRDYGRAEPHPEEWLLIEWPAGDKEPSQYWLSTLPATLVDLVHIAKLRWRIERDYQDLKQELGLDHYEGRGWRGFHHHATLCIMASSFASEVFFPLKSTSDAQRLRYPRARGHTGSAGTP